MNKFGDFTPISDVLKRFDKEEDKYISREFQKYGYDLAKSLGDLKHKALYMKLAKEEPRARLERIKHQVLESGKGSNLGGLFMWQLKQAHWREKLTKNRLSRDFYLHSPQLVAKKLLGKILVVQDQFRVLRAGEITETEAYLGKKDLASHARFGNQGRSKMMYSPPGQAYIYLIYGQHQMFNVVAHQKGKAGAVLIRSLKPVVGGKGKVAVGPGKLTSFLKIDQKHDGLDLVLSEKIWLAKGKKIPEEKINSGPRVGVDYAGPWAKKKLRFWPKYCRYLSKDS
ncbi:MAG: DNA-3-methyladenine glycosylase [Patescibacteria group bacterium]|jgi:DNA-3-methyladenine glycosylase